jgi:hypothetical protein
MHQHKVFAELTGSLQHGRLQTGNADENAMTSGNELRGASRYVDDYYARFDTVSAGTGCVPAQDEKCCKLGAHGSPVIVQPIRIEP